MPDGEDTFEKVILSAGANSFSFIGNAYNTEFWTNPFQWGVDNTPIPPEPPLTEGQDFPKGTL